MATSRRLLLLREYLSRKLYEKDAGYFETVPVIAQRGALEFSHMVGRYDYHKRVSELYAANAAKFLTPVELFQPYYSQIIANFVLANHASGMRRNNNPLTIVELGPGNGTNALHILDRLRETRHDVYDSLSYVMLDISPSMSRKQMETIATSRFANDHLKRVRAVCDDVTSPDSKFSLEFTKNVAVLALEVFDNLPHDKIVFDGNDDARETHVLIEEDTGRGVSETHLPLSDPLIRETMELFLTSPVTSRVMEGGFLDPTVVYRVSEEDDDRDGRDGSTQHDSLVERLVSRWVKFKDNRRRLRGASEMNRRSVFVPTTYVAMLRALRKRIPHHTSFLASDFSYLPPPDIPPSLPWCEGDVRGCLNAPIVTNVQSDCASYLSDSKVDVFFPTRFNAYKLAYESVMSIPRNEEQVRVMRHRDFMEYYGTGDRLVEGTRTRNGFNPMLEEFTNVKFLCCVRNDRSTNAPSSAARV